MSKISEYIRNPIGVREHGAWAILFVPIFTSITHVSNYSPHLVFLCFALLFLFLAYYPFEILLTARRTSQKGLRISSAKFWFTLYLLAGLLSAAVSLLGRNDYRLIYFGIAALALFTISILMLKKTKLSFLRELLGITALCLSAPAIIFSTEGKLTNTALILYLSNVLFFTSASFFVHLKLAEMSFAKDNSQQMFYSNAYNKNIFYLLILISALAIAALTKQISYYTAFAFIPMIFHCLVFAGIESRKSSFKKTGFLFLAYSIFFAAVISLFPVVK